MRFGEDLLRRDVLHKAVIRCRRNSRPLFRHLNRQLPEAAVLVPLINTDEGASVLFEVRSPRLRKHAGEMSFPGGLREAGESSWLCAQRECGEEIGWKCSRNQVLGSLGEWHNRKSDMRVTPWVVIHNEPFDLTKLELNETEVSQVFAAKLIDLLDPKKKELRRLHEGWPPVPFFHPDGKHIIWGFTGFVLAGFLNELTPLMRGTE